MNKLVLFAFALSFMGLSIAQHRLVVFNQEGKQFYIVLNGIKQNAEAQTNVKIDELTSDSYKLKIIFADGATPDIDKSIYFGDPNHEYVTEVRKNRKGEYKLRMVSYGPTSTNSYQTASTVHYTNTDAVANNNTYNANNNNATINTNNTNGASNTVTTHQTTTTITTNTNTNNGNGNNENINMNVNVGGLGMNVNVNLDENMSNVNQNATFTETYTTTTNTTTTNTNINQTGNNNGNQFGCFTPTVDYNSLIEAVKNESFADDKKMVAKQALNNKCISTDQVVGLMKEFGFDDDRLEMAKYCYDRCSDADNYFKVNSAFSFSDSKEELNKYIESK